jgi:hypothetical protein
MHPARDRNVSYLDPSNNGSDASLQDISNIIDGRIRPDFFSAGVSLPQLALTPRLELGGIFLPRRFSLMQSRTI